MNILQFIQLYPYKYCENLTVSDRAVYRMAVYQFYHVFLMIEEKLEDLHYDCDSLKSLYFPNLFRAPGRYVDQ